ncbi:MAG: amino acid transporter [Candidatus Melainabacteria bacterium]|nr:amino acid transporter [Candidatus Melainabacteria bacterium]
MSTNTVLTKAENALTTKQEIKATKRDHSKEHASWWRVMCLTGVDYFSTLGYQPGIAFLAAGILSPVATLIVVLLTLFGALPVYWVVARESPHGQGSIAMLEKLFPGWIGKTIVLVLLGFAATDFVITITLSAADATSHILENPIVQQLNFVPHNPIFCTSLLLLLLASVFLMGFREAIGLSTVLVIAYISLNVYILTIGGQKIMADPALLGNWQLQLNAQYLNPLAMIAAAALVFPKLALGLSGFETGVSVMPLVRGSDSDDPAQPQKRIANTRKLLLSAALIMSVMLMASSIVTTVLIPAALFAPGGDANGRAISYLAHLYMGPAFGSVYDIVTIAILWFAGASALAGLLTLVPRYLPRYGMAPEWTAATRPLVMFFFVVTVTVTLIFKANVDAQAAAYATGVLVLMTSAAAAVTVSMWKRSNILRFGFMTVTTILLYTTGANIVERPDGIQIASFFILTILAISLCSRIARSLELRIKDVSLDSTAASFIKSNSGKPLRIIAHRPGGASYAAKMSELKETHGLNMSCDHVIFLEVSALDPSEFEDEVLDVTGTKVGEYKIMHCQSPAVPNAIAALLLSLRQSTGINPHVYFGWTEGSPAMYAVKYIFFGEGETAPLTREILRSVEKDLKKRPVVHVG